MARLIASAERPLLYVGGGVVASGAEEEVRALSAACGIPVVCTLMGLGIMDPGDPLYLGMLGMHGSRATNLAVDRADLLIALGVRFDDRATGSVDGFAPRRPGHPHGHRRGRDREDPAARHLRGMRRETGPAEAEQDGARGRRGCLESGNPDPAHRLPPGDPRRSFASFPPGGGPGKGGAGQRDRDRRCRPAPDVGRAVLAGPAHPQLPHVGRAGHHGFRAPRRHGRGPRAPGHDRARAHR